jgi:hypothetical protein
MKTIRVPQSLTEAKGDGGLVPTKPRRRRTIPGSASGISSQLWAALCWRRRRTLSLSVGDTDQVESHMCLILVEV